MLPSCGHFKNIPCPFYKLALCVRPHCPYKHQNSENGHLRQLFTPLIDEAESLLDSKSNLNAILQKSSYNSIEDSQEKATYVPTPVDASAKPTGILKTSSNLERPSTSFVPEYRPTPISKLKEVSSLPGVKTSKSQYSPEYTVPIRKKKNVEEYDPTEVKCVPKKTVTFIESDETTDVPVVLISSDEEDDLEDPESAPKFSDDDDFEEETSASNSATKEVPEVITIKEEPANEEDKIDEFSVVDKILGDCKKNERLLNSFKKPTLQSAKTNNLPTKAAAVQKNDSSNATLPQKSEVKNNKSSSNVSIKIEKDITSSKGEEESSSYKLKSKKGDKLDSTKLKKSDSIKKVKIEKKETSSEKSKKNYSSHSKEKQKDSKESEKSKHSKKLPHDSKKSNSDDGKNSKSLKQHSSSESVGKIKSHKHLASNSRDKIKPKKLTENHLVKHMSSDNSTKKKIKSESARLDPNIKSHKISSNLHPVKRKYDISDSESEHHSSKHKSSDAKRMKSENSISVSKKVKSNDSGIPSNSSHSPSKSVKSNNPTILSDRTKHQSEDHSSNSDVDDPMLNDYLSSSESDDPESECRRIFEEFYPEDSVSAKEDKKEETSEPKSSKGADLVILRKKRYAHSLASELKPPNKVAKPAITRPLNPAQVMHNRFAQCQARFAQMNENKDSSKGTDKKRINFAPNQNLLAAVKNKNLDNPAFANFSPLPPTVSKSLKVERRMAHIPEAAMKPRPIIPAEYGSKVAANIRQKYLNAFIDECLKFCLSEDEAFDLALEEEKKVYERSSSRALYLNVSANALQRLRRRAAEGPELANNNNVSSKSASSKQGNRTVSHQTLLNGPLAQRRSFSIGPKKEAPEIPGGTALYEYMLTYILTPEQLTENSFPLPHPTEKDRAVISGAYASRTLYCNDAFKRMCSRCHKTYYVNVDGDYVRDEECDFHWGRLWKKRIAGSFESRYSCCQGDAESDGCCVSPGHVFDGSESHVLKGYVKTLPKTPPPDNNYGIYALDCEMCYTSAGMELTRVTVVDIDLKPVFESFVKPQHRVLDYNTRFSGITEEDLKNVRTSIQDVQAVLLCIFSDKTILIGHSLESDFKALKLIHKTVIDTSVVFPHKNGLPFKRALKTLMAEKLNKIIQNDVGGHDSHEDAAACMELMLWKVKEDIRSNR